jgi:hypothetical protein
MTQSKLTTQQVIDKFVKKRQDRQKVILCETSNILSSIIFINMLFFALVLW